MILRILVGTYLFAILRINIVIIERFSKNLCKNFLQFAGVLNKNPWIHHFYSLALLMKITWLFYATTAGQTTVFPVLRHVPILVFYPKQIRYEKSLVPITPVRLPLIWWVQADWLLHVGRGWFRTGYTLFPLFLHLPLRFCAPLIGNISANWKRSVIYVRDRVPEAHHVM